jgi:hypothetical protein
VHDESQKFFSSQQMIKEDSLLDFSFSVMSSEFPDISTETASSVRSLISQFLSGNLSYSEFHRRVVEQCGAANFVERLQEILTVTSEAVLEPKSPLPNHSDGKGARNKTRSWTLPEDNRLLAGIRKFGLDGGSTWSAIAGFVGSGRTRSQCSQRWLRVLDPRICKGQWTQEEDKRLLDLVTLYGEKSWMKISTKILSRSDVQCRYRYLQFKRGRTNQPEAALEKEKEMAIVQPAPRQPSHWGLSHAVIPILHQSQEELKTAREQAAEGCVFDFMNNGPIPLTASLDLNKSDSLSDSTKWLWCMDE